MNFKSKLFVLGLVTKIFATEFSVISFQGECQLNLGGSLYPMTNIEGTPLFKIKVQAEQGAKYSYICGGQQDVERTLNNPEKTYNELFGRSLTMYDMPEFSYPSEEQWTRSIGRTELFDPNYVPTVIIDADTQFFVDGRGSSRFNNIIFILQDSVFSFSDIPTSGKNGDEDKFQFRITLPDDGIFNRNVLKFRPSSYDPVFFRQILYGDIAHAIGNPAHESVATRVYLSDGTPIGLYVLQEDCTTESFVRSAFFGNSDGSIKEYEPNVIYDCSTGADFTANDGKFLGAFQNNTADNKAELLAMTQKLEALDVTDEAAIADFDQNDLDLNTLFKALALEYLAGHWDSYWYLSTNFVTYHPNGEPGNYKFYFIDQDFDQTWGVGMYAGLDPLNYPRQPYTEHLFKNWRLLNENEYDTETRVIVDKFLGCNGQPSCPTKTMFEEHLKSIVQHIFNPSILGIKVNGYKERLTEEMEWDTSLTRLHTGTQQQYHFTMNDFNNNIETANYEGSLFYWGVLDWTTAICDTVCTQFGITYDKAPYDPLNANQNQLPAQDQTQTQNQPMTANDNLGGSNLNLGDLSGSTIVKADIILTVLATLLSVLLF